MSQSPESPNAPSVAKQSSHMARRSPLLRSVAIVAHVWRNHFSPMSLSFFELKPHELPQEDPHDPGVVHRNIGKVDGLWVFLFLSSMLCWALFPVCVNRVVQPILCTEAEILDPVKLSQLMVDPEHPVFSSMFSRLSATSQIRWREAADGNLAVSRTQIAKDINGLLAQTNMLSQDLVSRTLNMDSITRKTTPDAPTHRMEAFARILFNRCLIDQQSQGALQVIEPSKLDAYRYNCAVLWWLQIILLSIAGYRVFDLFVVAVSNSPIGLSGATPTKRSPEQNKRLILTTFMGLIEMVFWYGILLFGCELLGFGQFKESLFSNDTVFNAPVHALQTSMSTVTTIGYGTYAPNCWVTTILCFAETLTGIVMLTMVVSSLIGVANQDVPYPIAKEILASAGKWCWIIAVSIASVVCLTAFSGFVLIVLPNVLFTNR
jgi:hypothetical protein